MPQPDFRAPEFSPESSGDAGGLSHAQANMHLEGQLNAPSDVAQAHQFFQPKVDSSLLSSINLHGEAAAAAPMTGGEHAAMSIAPGAEHAVMGAIPPGGEPVSPLIQLIMKLPGLTGVMNSFFEFLGALLHGNIMQAFDPALWAQHAAGAMSSAAGDHFNVSISLLPPGAPILHPLSGMMGQGLMPGNLANGLPADFGSAGLDSVSPDSLNISSPVNMQKPVFEDGLLNNYSLHDYPQDSMFRHFGQPENVAISPDAPVYRPTMGGFYQPSQNTAPLSSATTAPPSPSVHHAAAPHHTAQSAHHFKHSFKASEVKVEAKPAQEVQSPGETTDAAGSQYTVRAGDNLWDIARRNLGDGSRWHEIYNLNANVLGANPDLIQPGTTIQLPGPGADIASAAGGSGHYIVQPGDNLWDIARHKLGGGENWGEIYRLNSDVIGSNPSLIHPGQDLNLSATSNQIAAAPESSAGDLSQAAATPAASQPALSAGAAGGQPLQARMDTAGSPALTPSASSYGSQPTSDPGMTADSAGVATGATNSGAVNGVYQAPDGQLFFRKQQP